MRSNFRPSSLDDHFSVPRKPLTMIYILAALFLLCSYAHATDLDCTGESSLSAVISCVKSSIQPKESELYSPVTDEETHSLFYNLIQNITTEKQCELTLPTVLSPLFKTKNFTEDGSTYCIIYPYQDTNNDGYFDDGHGVYIINIETASAPTFLSVVVPHPLHDTNTPALGITVFSSLKALTFSVAGAHRHTNADSSACQSSYKEADVVHTTDSFFYTFHKAIHDLNLTSSGTGGWSGSTLPHVQFHSMGTSTCPGVDVFISSGFSDPPHALSPASSILSAATAAYPHWNISYPDALNSNGCNLYGTGNTIGRYMNDVPLADVCSTAADKSTALDSSVFVQVELKWDYRKGADWAPVMVAAFPPPPPTSFPTSASPEDCLPLSIKYGMKDRSV